MAKRHASAGAGKAAGWWVAGGLLVLLLSRPVGAQSSDPFSDLDADEVERLLEVLEAAEGAEADEDWERALERYREAEGILPLDQYRYRQAVCLEALDYYVEALLLFRELSSSDVESVARGARTRAATLERLAEHQPAPVRIETEPPDVLLVVDGDEMGRATEGFIELRLEPGSHAIEARRVGYVTEQQRIEVTPGVINWTAVELQRQPDVIVEPDLTSGPRFHPVSWVLSGAAVAALGAGVGLGVASEDRAEQERTYDLRSPGASREAANQLGNEANDLARWANISFGVGGALAVGALVTFFVLDGRSETPADTSPGLGVRPILAPDGLGAAIGVSF